MSENNHNPAILNYNKLSNEIFDYLAYELLKKDNQSPTESSFNKLSLIDNIYNFTLLYLLIKASSDFLSHDVIDEIAFEINYEKTSHGEYLELNSYVSFISKGEEDDDKYVESFYVSGSYWDDSNLPSYENENENLALYNDLEAFSYAMEGFALRSLSACENFFLKNETFNYENAMAILKHEYKDMFSLLDKKLLKENINTNKKAKSSKPKLL